MSLRTFYLRYLNDYRNRKVDGRDIELCYKDEKGFSPWRCWTEIKLDGHGHYLKKPDLHRSILGNEIVIEFDEPELLLNLCAAKLTITKLRTENIPFWLFYSGNKSFHLHIFLEPGDLPEEIDKKMEERKDPDIWYSFRDYLVWKVLSGIRRSFKVDSLKLRTRRTMIRACGSLHSGAGFHKVYISAPEELPNKLSEFSERYQLKEPPAPEFYPEEIAEWEMSEWLPYLQDFLRKPRRRRCYMPRRKTKGKIRTMPCLDYLLTHKLPDGWHRTVNLGAMRLKYLMGEEEVLQRLREFNRLNGNPVRDSYIKAQVHYAFRYPGTLGCKFARTILEDTGLLSLCEECKRGGGGKK
jgi:hypothetical protein